MISKKYALLFVLVFTFIGLSVAQDGKTLYSTHCAGCHGANLEGTSIVTALVKTDWKYGGGKQGITETIKNGVPSTTMAAWKTTLTDSEVNMIVEFILSSQNSNAQVTMDPTLQEATDSTAQDTSEQISSQKYNLKVEKLVTENIQTPWGIEFVNGDTALISERPGSLKWLIKGQIDSSSISGLPGTHVASSTGGYMDIALDPDYDQNRWVYLAFSSTNGNVKDPDAPAMTKVVRGKITDHQWVDQQTLFEVPDSLMVVRGNRWGCRFLFDDEGRLYFTIGDMGRGSDSQDVSKPTGKVFRINKDGTIPKDNPYVNEKNALPAIYTIGNRNVQGMDLHPDTRKIWVTEHGPRGGDEVNILKKGNNYGWPVITYGINYDGSIITEQTKKKGMEQPIFMWNPSIAVCPALFVSSSQFPEWKNNLLVGALAFQQLRRLTIVEDRVIHQEIVFKGMGRVRDLKFGFDGALYVLTNGPDQILKITPGK